MASTDRDALVAFFRLTGGANWKKNDSWGTAAELTTWFGVKVNDHGRVVELSLEGNGLRGNIPEELRSLHKLEKLSLGWNMLEGQIPKELGSLHNLDSLFLQNNKLFGPIPSELGQLGSLTQLVLGGNKLNGPIPKELGKLKALMHLRLYENKLTGPIPKELGDLRMLRELFLVNNNLTGSIPEALGALSGLQVLGLADNMLTGSIPKELGMLTLLSSLFLQGNNLEGTIPKELGALRWLSTLHLSRNKLTAIWDHTHNVRDVGPEKVAYSLPGGRRLRILPGGRCKIELVPHLVTTAGWSDGFQPCNNLISLMCSGGGPVPRELRRLLDVLHRCGDPEWKFGLSHNPWAEPPESIVAKGPKSIKGYFEDLYAEPGRVRRSSVKVILVGQEGAGKTSLRRSMKANEATPTGECKEESTVFADIEPMELRGSSVRVYDCAGQVAYTGLLQMFLTPRSVCVLVCNAEAFGQQESTGTGGQVEEDCHKLEDLRVCDWLRSISQRIPGNDVILVATKCDLVGENAGKVGRSMEEACRKWLASWVHNGMQPICLEHGVSLTSCCPTVGRKDGEIRTGTPGSEGGWVCDWLDDRDDKPLPSLLHRLVNKPNGGGLRGAQMVLPRSWDIALTVLDALEHGRVTVEMVMGNLANPSKGDATETAGGKTAIYQGITVENLNSKWQEAVAGLGKRGIAVINANSALEGALSIREFDGSLIRHETYVFLDVVWLTRILKPLLNHKDEETFDGLVNLGDTGDTRVILEDPLDIASWGRLKNQGVLEPRLARTMWPDGLSKYVLPTLASLGLTFPLESDPAGGLVVLLRLNPDRPERVGKVIDTFCLDQTPAFSASWKIFLGVPAGAIEKVLTRCCSLGGVQTFWRSGVLVHGGFGEQDGHEIFAVVLEYSSSDNELTAQIFGDLSTPAPWMALSYVISAVRLMLLDFPGLRSRGYLKCPQHDDGMLLTDEATGAGQPLLERRGCPQCSPDTRGLGAAAVNLVHMVDIRLDRDVILREVKARFIELEGQYSFPRPAANSIGEDELIGKMNEMAVTAVKGALGEMDGRFGKIQGGIDEVHNAVNRGRGEMVGGLDEVKETVTGGLDEAQDELKRGLDGITGQLSDVKVEMKDGFDAIKGRLDTVAESTQESLARLKDLQAPNYLYPRLVVVKEIESGRTSSRASGKKNILSKFRGVVKKEMMLHFLCPVNMSKVPCGYGGEGYRFRETRDWVKKISPVLQVAAVTATVALKATTGLDVNTSDFLRDMKDGLVDQLVDRTLDEDTLLRVLSGEEDVGADMQKDTRASYEALKKFMDKEQVDRLKNARDGDGYVDFRDKMKRVPDGRGGMVWVRNENVQRWLDSHSNNAPSR